MYEGAEEEMKRRSPLKKSIKPIPKRRTRPRVRKECIRLAGKPLQELREEVWNRDGRKCAYEGCGRPLPLNGSLWERMHLSHIVSRGAGGSDIPSNTKCMCRTHHLDWLHNCEGKPIKITKKEALAAVYAETLAREQLSRTR